MQILNNTPSRLLLAVLLTALIAAGCTATAQTIEIEVTRVVPQTVVVTQIVEKVVTATPEPAPLPTATPAEPILLEDGFTGWCLPETFSRLKEPITSTGGMPEEGQPVEVVDGIKEVTTEVSACIFTYTFNQPAPEGLLLQFYDTRPDPFLTAEMMPVQDNPNIAYVKLNHPYIIDPPFWQINYQVALVSAGGEDLWSEPMSFRRGWIPEKCYYGEWPDPVTGRCPPLPEGHPWDPFYGWEEPYPYGFDS